MNQERKRYLQQQRKQEHKQKERAKRQVLPGKSCCPVKLLGCQPGPEKGVKMWLTKCRICKRIEYGQLGIDKNQREGFYFRGLWFKDIDPEKGAGTTFEDHIISLTQV